MKRFEDGTFGEFSEYGCLAMICDRLEKMGDKQSEYISHFIHNFNTHINNLFELKDEHTFRFVLQCVRDEYHDRVLALVQSKYDPYFLSHIMNYVVTKIRKCGEEFDKSHTK
jgi:hypothetical protein